MTDLQSKQPIDLMFDKTTKYTNNIYHYTTADVTNLILNNEDVCLKMTLIDNFSDKLEGKTVDKFYNRALKKLLKENKISKSQYELLVKIKAPQKNVSAFYEGNGVYRGEMTESDIYITCFSKEKDDPYMVKKYIKNKNHSGYCLIFSCCELKANELMGYCFDVGFSLKMFEVKYEKQVILEMYDFIEKLVRIFDGCDDKLKEHSKAIIEAKLNELKYTTKLEKFRKENEIRLVLITPKGHLPHKKLRIFFDSAKSDCIVKFPKCVIKGISKSPKLRNEEDIYWRKNFEQKGYKFVY